MRANRQVRNEKIAAISTAIFLLLEEGEEEQNIEFLNVLISVYFPVILCKWPFWLYKPILRIPNRLPGGALIFFKEASSSSLEKVTRLNRPTFDLLLDFFERYVSTYLMYVLLYICYICLFLYY